ncbi:hypothetical protein A3762_10240 [Oleiphilus sp. HI0125]|uniref:ATP-dependent DNA helicase DinG n=3 Tax=unclassified Oleiphilus TaxID=2631174 RepID=UPI0007C3BDC0|nr:ATP-dependent DNA helicase DinG [Oleiphilus sp. HI0125]KZZ57225.1 hypothetical protein A3762_10240 [Oleiphilus sp. HI0125]
MLSQEQKALIQSSYSKFTGRDGFRPRYGQRLMIAEIAKYLGSIKSNAEGLRNSAPTTCVVEAGTGTGKTLGYCMATLPIAIELGKKLVVSTATTALQDQILSKDLPELAKHSGIDFSYALAKGRGRYVCLSKLEQRIESFSADPNDATIPLFLIDQGNDEELSEEQLQGFFSRYASGAWDGDRDTLEEQIDSRAWSMLTADNQQCSNRRCSYFSSCPYYEARNRWDEADVLIANHDLLLSDLALGGGVILPAPEQSIYVFDEAHHLPDKALGHFMVTSGLKASQSWLKSLSKSLAEMLPAIQAGHFVASNIEQISPLSITLQQKIDAFYMNLAEGLDWDQEEGASESRYRFTDGILPNEVKEQAYNIKLDFASLCRYLDEIRAELNRSVDEKSDCGLNKEEAEQWYPVIGSHFNRADGHYALWQFYSKDSKPDDQPDARWATLRDYENGSDIYLFGSPLSAGGLLNIALWKRAYGAVLTSATLTALGKFDHLRHKAGLPEGSVYHRVPSPFDFQQAGLLRVPPMRSLPNQAQAHTQELIDDLEDWIEDHKAVLVLFSSRKQMNDVFYRVDRDLREDMLTQDDMGKQELIQLHKKKIDQGKRSILFGLASLAEGIDLPGKYLTHVVIAKVPFAVPNDPLEQAIAEWIESQGRNPFMEISVPEASLRLIQACGRLIRTEQDSGQITILDQRLITKRYGSLLLDALPPYRRQLGS